MKIKTYSLEELKKIYNLIEYDEWYFIKGKLSRYRLFKENMVNDLLDKELYVTKTYPPCKVFPYSYKAWSVPAWIIKEDNNLTKDPKQLEFDL